MRLSVSRLTQRQQLSDSVTDLQRMAQCSLCFPNTKQINYTKACCLYQDKKGCITSDTQQLPGRIWIGTIISNADEVRFQPCFKPQHYLLQNKQTTQQHWTQSRRVGEFAHTQEQSSLTGHRSQHTPLPWLQAQVLARSYIGVSNLLLRVLQAIWPLPCSISRSRGRRLAQNH